jgi:hypothetical protein
MNISRLIAFWLLLGVWQYSAFAQIYTHGSVVVIYFDQDKIAIAADSRGVGTDPFVAPDDTQCKLAALGEHILFADVGVPGMKTGFPQFPVPGINEWDNLEEARNAYRIALYSGHDVLIQTAKEWAYRLALRWGNLYRWEPLTVRDLAKRGNGIITQGTFGGLTDKGKLTPIQVDIVLDEGRKDAVFFHGREITCPRTFCATGVIDAFLEYRDSVDPISNGPSVRAQHEEQEWAVKERSIVPADRPVRKTMRFVELQFESPLVGGAIDAAEISNRGQIRWVAQKKECKN